MASKATKTPRVDRESRKTDRALELFLMLQRHKYRIPLSELSKEKWGSRKTITRTVEAINRVWSMICGGTLAEIVREDGSIMGPGERYIQLVDQSLKTMNFRDLAVYFAYLGLSGQLQGTSLHQSLKMHLDYLKTPYVRSDAIKITRMAQKFCSIVSNSKIDLKVRASIINDVYDALIDEKIIEISLRQDGGIQTFRLKCLTLFSDGEELFLMAQNEKDPFEAAPDIFPLYSIIATRIVSSASFKYPPQHNPQRILDDLG